MKKEKKTVESMIRIYCNGNHDKSEILCNDCNDLLNYAFEKLDKCPFGENKFACSRCNVHCYSKIMREKIKMVMKYSGPRMIFKHPIMTFYHLLKD